MREQLVPIAAAVLCILALALGAAALGGDLNGEPAEGTDTGETADGDGSTDADVPVDDTAEGDDTQSQIIPEDDECLGGYDVTDMGVLVFAAVIGATVLVFVRTQSMIYTAVSLPLLLFPALILTALVAFFVLDCPPPGLVGPAEGEGIEPQLPEVADDGESGDDEESPASLSSRLTLGGIALAVVLALFLAGLYVQRRHASGPTEEAGYQTPATAPDIAAAAGEAADEIDEAAGDHNGVYRAWVRMTEVLDVDHPTTSTPREFAAAAKEAGIEPGDVSELTALFEQVRYGPTEVTAEHEQRARETLRRIERTHGVDSTSRQKTDTPGDSRSSRSEGK